MEIFCGSKSKCCNNILAMFTKRQYLTPEPGVLSSKKSRD